MARNVKRPGLRSRESLRCQCVVGLSKYQGFSVRLSFFLIVKEELKFAAASIFGDTGIKITTDGHNWAVRLAPRSSVASFTRT